MTDAANYMTLLLNVPETPANARRLRLFGVACCNRVPDLMSDERARNAVDVAERFADGNATYQELDVAARLAKSVKSPGGAAARNVVRSAPRPAAWFTAYCLAFSDADRVEQAQIAADIFDSPSTPSPLSPSLLTTCVKALAQSIYDDRAFDRLPELADALEEADCRDADILAHCRGEGPHVRGCWVLDVLLGKE